MLRPVEIHFHEVPRSEALEGRIRTLAERLDRFYPCLLSCLVFLERPHRHRHTHGGWRVGIEVNTVPGGQVVVSKSSDAPVAHDDVYRVVDEAFDAMARRLKRLTQARRGEVKHHPAQEVRAVVKQLFPDHGFLRTHDGHDVYFHRHSVVGADFEGLQVGMGVCFHEEEGEQGPQASTVRVLAPEPVPLRPRKRT